MLPLALKYSKNARELGVGCGQFHSGVNGLTYSRQGQHSKNIFLAKTNSLVIRSIWAKKFLNLVESSIFYALSKSRLKCYTTAFQGVWAAVADDVYPGTKHSGASVNSLYLLEKIERKTNRSDVFCVPFSRANTEGWLRRYCVWFLGRRHQVPPPQTPKTRSWNTSSATLKGHRKSRIQPNSKISSPKCFK